MPHAPLGSFEADASKVTTKGALPDRGLAERIAIGGLSEQLMLPTRVYVPVAPVVWMVSKNPAPAPARRNVLPPILPSLVPGALAFQSKATPVAGAPGALKWREFATLSLMVIVPLAVCCPEIAAQVDVALAVHAVVSRVPVAVGSLLPRETPGVAGLLGLIVLTSTKTVSGFALVSVTPKMICHSEFGGKTVLPVPVGSSA